MKQVMFSVFDIKAGAFGRPFFSASRGLAVRSLGDEVNRAAQDNVMYAHAEDFRLFELGNFDDESGTFELHAVPHLVLDAVTLKAT